METAYRFTIPIGDWSDDGHGKCEYFEATADKPFKDVCKAFKEARDVVFKDDDFSPEYVCSDYQDNVVPEETVELLKKHGFDIDPDNFYTREFAELVVWFLNKGDPGLNARLTPKGEEIHMLRNWDYCETMGVRLSSHEGLDGFGYGLLGD